MKHHFLLLLLITFLACNLNSNQAVQIDKEVIQMHDEAMSKSSEVLKLKRQINQKLDSTFENGIKDSLLAISVRLYTADKMMLDWMHQYNAPNYETDTAVDYLKIQLEKIKKVHSITFESIKAAKEILKDENQ